MALDSFDQIVTAVLDKADEGATAAASDFAGAAGPAELAVIQFFRDLTKRWPWTDLVKDPPGVLLTVAKVTTLTLTVATAGSAVAGTLGATFTPSLAGRKVLPSGKDYHVRITAHTAGTNAVTLDAAPETLTAIATTIVQDEYDLASDVGVLVNGLWTQEGQLVRLASDEENRILWGDPPKSGWPATYFSRLTRRKIRFSSYPDAVKRLEYPYCFEPTDPTGATTLVIGDRLRIALLKGALSEVLGMKKDNRAAGARQEAEFLIAEAIGYESRLRRPVMGHRAQTTGAGIYGS